MSFTLRRLAEQFLHRFDIKILFRSGRPRGSLVLGVRGEVCGVGGCSMFKLVGRTIGPGQ